MSIHIHLAPNHCALVSSDGMVKVYPKPSQEPSEEPFKMPRKLSDELSALRDFHACFYYDESADQIQPLTPRGNGMHRTQLWIKARDVRSD